MGAERHDRNYIFSLFTKGTSGVYPAAGNQRQLGTFCGQEPLHYTVVLMNSMDPDWHTSLFGAGRLDWRNIIDVLFRYIQSMVYRGDIQHKLGVFWTLDPLSYTLTLRNLVAHFHVWVLHWLYIF